MAKKSANGAGSIRKKEVVNGDTKYTYWEARVTVGKDPGTGKQIQKSITGKTQKEVLDKLRSLSAEVADGAYTEPSKLTVSAWADIWCAEYMGDKKYQTVRGYKSACKNHIKPTLGATKLVDLKPHQIQIFYNDLSRSGLSPKTVRNIHIVLSTCLNTAVATGYLKDNPSAKATPPKLNKKEITPLTNEQIAILIDTADNDVYGKLFRVILFTGMRKAEACGLTWDSVDFAKGTIKVSKQLQKRPICDGGYVFAPLKNDKTRIIKPAPFVLDILRERQTEQLAERFRAKDLWQGWQTQSEQKKYAVFTQPDGTYINPKGVYNHYKKLANKIGAPDSTVHDLRHTYAVISLQNGDDIKTVQSNLGHATAAFTLDVYGHVSDKMLDNSSARMQQYFDSISLAK